MSTFLNRAKVSASIGPEGRIIIGGDLAGFLAPEKIKTLGFVKRQNYLLEGINNTYELGYLSFDLNGEVMDGEGSGVLRVVTKSNVNEGSGFQIGTSGLQFSIPALQSNLVACFDDGNDMSAPVAAARSAMAIGAQAKVAIGMTQSVAIGQASHCIAPRSVAIGANSSVTNDAALAEIYRITRTDPTTPYSDVNMAGGVAVGYGARAIGTGVVVGEQSNARHNGVAIGHDTLCSLGSTVVGARLGSFEPGQTIVGNPIVGGSGSVVWVWRPLEADGSSTQGVLNNLSGDAAELRGFTDSSNYIMFVSGHVVVQDMDRTTFRTYKLEYTRLRRHDAGPVFRNIGSVVFLPIHEVVGAATLNDISIEFADDNEPPYVVCPPGPTNIECYFLLDFKPRPVLGDLVAKVLAMNAEITP